LAGQIAKARRQTNRPEVKSLNLSKGENALVLSLSGSNLAWLDPHDAPIFPIAFVNRRRARVLAASADEIQLALSGDELHRGTNEVTIALDRYSLVRMEVNA
jgi:hypothetical protein